MIKKKRVSKSARRKVIRCVILGGSIAILFISFVIGNGYMAQLQMQLDMMMMQSESEGLDYTQVRSIAAANEQSNSPLIFINWHQESGGTISYPELGREETADILTIYGKTTLLFPEKSMLEQGNDSGCLISEELAYHLFGGTDVSGNVIIYMDKAYEIIDVLNVKTPLFVHELSEENVETKLDRVAIYTGDDSWQQIAERYELLAGEWKIVDYEVVYHILCIVYFIVPWIMGIGLLALIKKYIKRSREKIFWKVCFWSILAAITVVTFLLIRIPDDVIPNRWSDFGFWSNYFSEKSNSLSFLYSIEKGVRDLYYLDLINKAVIYVIISIIGAITTTLFAYLLSNKR